MSSEENLTEIEETARRAGSIVTQHIDGLVEHTERQTKQIVAEAHEDAARVRRDAVDSARRLLERLHALEGPLGQLVLTLQSEVDRVARELAGVEYVEAHPTTPGAAPASVPSEPASESAATEPQAAEEPGDEEEAAVEATPGRRLSRRRRSKRDRKATTEDYCAVCNRAAAGEGEDRGLKERGWAVGEDVVLCPHCKSQGWQLSDGGRLPVKPGAAQASD